jgi:hypothetical protein
METNKISRSHKEQLASLFNVTEDYVSKVATGKRHNKAIYDAWQHLIDEEKKTLKRLQMKLKKRENYIIEL